MNVKSYQIILKYELILYFIKYTVHENTWWMFCNFELWWHFIVVHFKPFFCQCIVCKVLPAVGTLFIEWTRVDEVRQCGDKNIIEMVGINWQALWLTRHCDYVERRWYLQGSTPPPLERTNNGRQMDIKGTVVPPSGVKRRSMNKSELLDDVIEVQGT